MKRQREEIMNDLVDNKKIISNLKNIIIHQEKNYEINSIELDNFDIDQHKNDTIKQFDVWKKELGNMGDNVLDSYIIIDWDVKCHIAARKHCPYKKRIYTNNISIMLNCELFIDFSVDCTNDLPNSTKFTLWYSSDNHNHNIVIDLSKITYLDELTPIADKLKITTEELFEIIALFYHAFMFDPKCPSLVYISIDQSKFMNILTKYFGLTRCSYNISFHNKEEINEISKWPIAQLPLFKKLF